MKVAAVILAGGESKRLGYPKQLIECEGQALILRTVKQVLKAGINSIVVVTGAHHDSIVNALLGTVALNPKISIVRNHDWNAGMGRSIAVGIEYIVESMWVEGVLLLTSDQPYVTSEVLRELVAIHQEAERGIVLSDYGGQNMGPPAFFGCEYFDDLMGLDGDVGAKAIAMQNRSDLGSVYFGEGSCDLDTAEDVKCLMKGSYGYSVED